MTLTVVMLNPYEEFLQFLDPDLVTLKETIEKGGLRTLEFEYKFQDLSEDKELFQPGNKIWISGDVNLTDCLYVINTNVENSIYKGNYFKFEVEEALVELNYAPPFSQTDLSNSAFTIDNTNGKQEVVLNWNALNYWFGSYFNIGIVQKCINNSSNQMVLTGTMSLMSLLRQIEEESGNIFVTRYEKDLNNNTIHRYLDFLNPINVNKDWEINIEYDFIDTTDYHGATDSNGNPVNDEFLDMEDYETDYTETPTYNPVTNVTPSDILFRITKDGEVVKIGNTPLQWTNTEAGFTSTSGSFVIQLTKDKNLIGIETKTKSFAVQETNTCDALNNNGYIDDTTYDPATKTGTLPDDSYFEMYDQTHDKVIFHTLLNFNIGSVHEEILEFNYNVENVVYDVDETDTLMGVAPTLSLNENGEDTNSVNRTNLANLISAWKNLSITKGTTVPMIIEKISVNANSYSAAVASLENQGGYYTRPLNPNDNEGTSYEFLRGTGYWRAPYNKQSGELYIKNDKLTQTKYTEISPRQDNRDFRGSDTTPKLGYIDCNEENIYSIYKEVANHLKDHETPKINVEVDVANLRDYKYNDYQLHDKVYIKIEDQTELITARVVKTTKEAHDVAKTEIELDNYSIQTIKRLQDETYFQSGNVQFTYPKTGSLTARLCNLDYDSTDKYSEQYPPLKLVTFTVMKDGNIEQVFTKLTDAYGYATVPLALTPGDYTVEIYYPGDEEYTETSIVSYVNVDGTFEDPSKMPKTSTSKSKTTKKKKKTKVKKTYWKKCGSSPDGKELVSIAKPSGPDANKYGYRYYKTVFKNKCPICGKTGKLAFDGGKENKCITSAGAKGRGYKINVPEHEITCNACDSDFCGVTGAEKWNPSRGRLTTIKKPVKSNSNEFSLLVKGKLQYGTTKTTTSKKNTTSSKTRQQTVSNINSKVKKQALNIVGDSKGWQAAHKIVDWVTNNIKYGYETGFTHPPEETLSRKTGNCCNQTWLMLTMMDAAGVTEFVTLKYVHVCCGPKGVGHVYARLVHKQKGTMRYVDPCNTRQGGWNGPIKGWGSPPGSQSVYPTKPF